MADESFPRALPPAHVMAGQVADIDRRTLLAHVAMLQAHWRAVCEHELHARQTLAALAAQRAALPFPIRYHEGRQPRAPRCWTPFRDAWHALVHGAIRAAGLPLLEATSEALRVGGWPDYADAPSDDLQDFEQSEWEFARRLDLVALTEQALDTLQPSAVEAVREASARRALASVLVGGRPPRIEATACGGIAVTRAVHAYDWRLSQNTADQLSDFVDAATYLAERRHPHWMLSRPSAEACQQAFRDAERHYRSRQRIDNGALVFILFKDKVRVEMAQEVFAEMQLFVRESSELGAAA